MVISEDIKILAVDSSSISGGVALYHGCEPVAESFLNVRSTHSDTLMRQIDISLDLAGWTLGDLDLFSAVSGPGSFTGLRIGVALVKGLAQVTAKPVVGVSSLRAVAAAISGVNEPVCAFIDARKQEVYAQLFDCSGAEPLALNDAAVIAPQKLLKQCSKETYFIGSGVPVYRDLLLSVIGDSLRCARDDAHLLRPGQVARLAFNAWKRQEQVSAAELLPTYIRPSDAELNLQSR